MMSNATISQWPKIRPLLVDNGGSPSHKQDVNINMVYPIKITKSPCSIGESTN